MSFLGIPSWVIPVALAAALLASLGVAYEKGRSVERVTQELTQTKLALAAEQAHAAKVETALKADAEQAQVAADHAAALSARIKDLSDYVSHLEDRDRVCLSGTDTGRLRDLWGPAADPRVAAHPR